MVKKIFKSIGLFVIGFFMLAVAIWMVGPLEPASGSQLPQIVGPDFLDAIYFLLHSLHITLFIVIGIFGAAMMLWTFCDMLWTGCNAFDTKIKWFDKK